MSTALISLGSNVGPRRLLVEDALSRLTVVRQVRVERTSTLYETMPAGGPHGQERYLNASVRLEASCSPFELLVALQRIELELGRVRENRWGARSMDLDLLLFGATTLRTKVLEIPHPRMAFRRFVLEPASEIAGEMMHPLLGLSVERLFQRLQSNERIILIGGPEFGLCSRIAHCVSISEPIMASDSHLFVIQRSNSSGRWESSRLEFSTNAPASTRQDCVESNVNTVQQDRQPVDFSEANLVVMVCPTDGSISKASQFSELHSQVLAARCPWLIVPGSDYELCVMEVAGAIQAMR